MPAADVSTINALRSDLALQINRFMRRRGLNQLAAAKRFGVPQPTLSKIANGRVADLSLELLIRIAVRAGLPVVLQTGQVPEEAGAFVSVEPEVPKRSRAASGLSDAARASLIERTRRLTPEQRLATFLVHTELGSALHQAGHAAEATRVRKTRRLR
jgi:predicted XRE-type DNA-binding protein